MRQRIIATCVDEAGRISDLSVQVSGRGITSPLLPVVDRGIRILLEGLVADGVRVMHVRTIDLSFAKPRKPE